MNGLIMEWSEGRVCWCFDINVEFIENCGRRIIGEKNFCFNDIVDIINVSEEGESEVG